MSVKRHLDLVGIREIADRLGVRTQTASAWRYRGLLPEPEWEVSGRAVWRWKVIRRWADQTGRR